MAKGRGRKAKGHGRCGWCRGGAAGILAGRGGAGRGVAAACLHALAQAGAAESGVPVQLLLGQDLAH